MNMHLREVLCALAPPSNKWLRLVMAYQPGSGGRGTFSVVFGSALVLGKPRVPSWASWMGFLSDLSLPWCESSVTWAYSGFWPSPSR